MSEEVIWAAGYLSAKGSITNGPTTPRLMVLSTNDEEGTKRFAKATNLVVTRDSRNRWSVTASGERLHEVMVMLWPYLTEYRKLDYLRVRAKWQRSIRIGQFR